MNLPIFNAERSLCPTTRRYRSRYLYGDLEPGAVPAQQLNDHDAFDEGDEENEEYWEYEETEE